MGVLEVQGSVSSISTPSVCHRPLHICLIFVGYMELAFVRPFNKYLQNLFYKLDVVLGAGDTAVNKTDKSPSLLRGLALQASVREGDSEMRTR